MKRRLLSVALFLTACLAHPECSHAACTAGFGSPNEVVSYDGYVSYMDFDNKYLISTFQPTSADVCKFQVRIDTADDGGQIEVDWIAVAFGVHQQNSARFERNFRVSMTQGVVEARGRGYQPPGPVAFPPVKQCIETDSLNWYFCIEKLANDQYVITGGRVNGACWIEVTYWEDAANNDKVVINVSNYYKTLLDGMCGDWSNNPIPVNPVCQNTSPGVPQPCVDGDHQNN